MTLDPRDRKSWSGFLDLLQPPVGYRLASAVGTTFGLSLEALTAALLAMSDTDGESLANEPVAGVMAVTKLQTRVRVLVHPATISSHSAGGGRRFVALLDRMVVQVQPKTGLFHPKVWALRFEKVGNSKSGEPHEVGRLIVCSRNLSSSTSFELSSVFEGKISDDGEEASSFSIEVADALQAWMSAATVRVPKAVWRLPRFIRQLTLDVPHEASKGLRFRWQGQDRRQPLSAALPQRLERAVVVSPFVGPAFVSDIVSKTKHLQLISTPESLDALDDATFDKLEALRESQGSPVLYQVTDHGDPDGGNIDGLHAKLLLIEDNRSRSITYVGSANATGPGWGLGSVTNVEAMAELYPGIGIDRFVSWFLRENKSKVHPWVMEYDRASRIGPDPEKDAERKLLAALRDVAKLDLVLRYDAPRLRLTLLRTATGPLPSSLEASPAIEFAFAPLLLNDRPEAWRQMQALASSDCVYDEVSVEKLTAFVAIRARSKTPPVEKTRLLLAKLEVDEADLDRRDDAIRQDIMATADPAAVLNALVRGLAHLPTSSPVAGNGSRDQAPSMRQLLGDTNLERLLQAVALEPGLVTEMRMLLGPIGGSPFQRLCDDLDEVIRRVRAEVVS